MNPGGQGGRGNQSGSGSDSRDNLTGKNISEDIQSREDSDSSTSKKRTGNLKADNLKKGHEETGDVHKAGRANDVDVIDAAPGTRKFTEFETLAEILVRNNLTEIEYEESGRRFYISKKGPPTDFSQQFVSLPAAQFSQATPTAQAPVVAPEKQPPAPEPDIRTHPGTIKSPMVGVAYTAPEPGAEPFVRVGDVVHPGQTILIVEAMKILNPIKATKAGKVIAILVHDRKPVEYDEPLIVIE